LDFLGFMRFFLGFTPWPF